MEDTLTVMVEPLVGDAPEPVEIPRRVGFVKLGELLGQGASGAVFSGFDEALNRRVAVKVLCRYRGATRSADRVRVVDGVRSAARVKHANITAIHTVDLVGEIPFIVMEFVEGVTLRELLLRSGALDAALVLHLMQTLTGAVATLHNAQVVHRDLKPANVLIDPAGELHVCDLGLACDFSLAHFAQGTDTIAGSPLYMAPEMFDGYVSPQSDVYALGVMMFEMLTGRPPFKVDSMDQARIAHQTQPPDLSLLHQLRLSEDLTDCVERALNKQRILRYKSAGHMLRALEAAPETSRATDALRRRVVDLVLACRARTTATAQIQPPDPGPANTYDLLARRAQQKRSGR